MCCRTLPRTPHVLTYIAVYTPHVAVHCRVHPTCCRTLPCTPHMLPYIAHYTPYDALQRLRHANCVHSMTGSSGSCPAPPVYPYPLVSRLRVPCVLHPFA